MRRSLILVVVIGATLAACGGGGGSGGDVITASAIVRDTTAAGSARIAMTSTPSGSGGHVATTMNGVTDFGHQSGELMNKLSDTATWTIRWVGGHVYLRSTVAPGSENPVPSFFASGKWYRMDDTRDDQTAAAFTHVFRPDFLLDALRSSARSVRTIGSDRIRDVPTTHLQLVVDNAAMERKLADGATVTTEEGQDAPTPTQTVEVWVDARHRLRRVSVVETETESKTATKTVSTMDFYDYGVRVDVQPPPANEITDFPNFDQLATSSATTARPSP